MKTTKNTLTHKEKTIELKYSNMTFVITARCHYMKDLNTPGWSMTKYTGIIKETGEGIGLMGSRKLIRSQIHLINSNSHLFLK